MKENQTYREVTLSGRIHSMHPHPHLLTEPRTWSDKREGKESTDGDGEVVGKNGGVGGWSCGSRKNGEEENVVSFSFRVAAGGLVEIWGGWWWWRWGDLRGRWRQIILNQWGLLEIETLSTFSSICGASVSVLPLTFFFSPPFFHFPFSPSWDQKNYKSRTSLSICPSLIVVHSDRTLRTVGVRVYLKPLD